VLWLVIFLVKDFVRDISKTILVDKYEMSLYAKFVKLTNPGKYAEVVSV